MTRLLAGAAATALALMGCSGAAVHTSAVAPAGDDAAISEAGLDGLLDAAGDATVDGLVAAGDTGAADSDGSCGPQMVDAALIDGKILGLPTKEVPTLAPVMTPQTAATDPAAHFQKQVGVLNLSPTIKDAQSVVHMLAPMGIPYAITTSPVLAIQHDMAVFFPEASPSSFDATAMALLNDYLRGGGVVVMKYSEVDVLKRLGGVASSKSGGQYRWVTLTDAGKARFPSLDQTAEQKIPLGGDSGDAGAFLNTWAMSVDPAAAGVSVLATFDDGTAAIVEHQVPLAPDAGAGSDAGTTAGRVVTFGVDWRDVVLRNQLGHSIDAARGYINLFEPATDSWMLMLRDIYDASVRFGVRLQTAPRGKRAALLVSHDLDWGQSYANAIQYAADEQEHGATAEYFVHTKYVTDSQDVAFFGPERETQLLQMMASGGRIGSHTVAHSPVLHTFPVGDGTEAYPAYAPANLAMMQTVGGTLFGELRVSKSLIDGALASQCVEHDVVSFRAGNLDYHVASPQTMERLGYRFDSTQSVGAVLSNFPYRAMTDWPDELDTTIFEFPVTIEDQLPPRLDQRVADALAIISANADNGAPTTLLIHPNVLDYKENAEKAILDGLPAGVQAMSVDEYAAFWRARDSVRIASINYDDEKKTLTLAISTSDAIDGLTLRVAPSVQSVMSPSAATLVPGSSGGDGGLGAAGNLVLLPPIAAQTSLVVVLGYL